MGDTVQVGPFRISQEFVDDVVTTAFEGGIDYWVNRIELEPGPSEDVEYGSEGVSRGYTVNIFHGEGEEESHGLTLERFIQGLLLWVQDQDIDAGDADNIIQYALFGSVIYG